MTIKELKEKIKGNPNLRRSEIVSTIIQLNELNENVDIKMDMAKSLPKDFKPRKNSPILSKATVQDNGSPQ